MIRIQELFMKRLQIENEILKYELEMTKKRYELLIDQISFGLKISRMPAWLIQKIHYYGW